MSSWHDIWERRKLEHDVDPATITLRQLMDLDGWDHGPGSMSEHEFRHLVGTIAAALDVDRAQSVLEVGCGAGAVLWCLRERGLRLSGVDYSAKLLTCARRALPDVEFHLSEASTLPFDDAALDAVFANGVFHYFADLDYARRVLIEMARVTRPSGRILVLDLPDAAKQAESDATRVALGAHPEPNHLYYPRAFIVECAAELGRRLVLQDQAIPGYANAPFRFNALFLPFPTRQADQEA